MVMYITGLLFKNTKCWRVLNVLQLSYSVLKSLQEFPCRSMGT